jgi:hypothetical protein
MKKTAFLLIPILLLILVCSCELAYDAPEVGKMHILVYGNDYAGTSNKLTKTINDAVQVGNALVKLCEKAGRGYDITYLIGPSTSYNSSALIEDSVINDVSTNMLLNTLNYLASSESANETDITIFYYSGHGKSDVFNHYYLNDPLSYATTTNSFTYLATYETSLYGSDYELLRIDTLQTKISAIPGTKVIFSDFCFSGALVQSDYVSITSGEYSDMGITDLYRERDRINDVANSLNLSSIFYLTAARYNQESYEIPDRFNIDHGYFTKALLDALGWDEDSKSLTTAEAEKNDRITLFNVANYVIENDKNTKQTPMLSGGSNDVILFSF